VILYSDMYGSLPVAITVWDTDLCLLYANESASKDIGEDLTPYVGQSICRLIPGIEKLPVDLNPLNTARLALSSGQTQVTGEVPLDRAEGAQSFTFTFSRMGDGNLVCCIQSDTVFLNMEAMREVERKLLMLEHLGGYATYTDMSGGVVSVNKLPPSSHHRVPDVSGLRIHDLFPEKARGKVEKALATQAYTEKGAEYSFSSPGLPQGRWFHTQVKTVELPAEGKVLLWVSWDTTEQKHTQDQISNANEDLEQFAYIVSHDLQEPIRTIAAYIDILLEDYPHLYKGGEPEEFMKYIRDSALRQQKLIQDLLTYSRTSNMSFEYVNLHKCYLSVRKSLENLIQRTGASLKWDGCETCLEYASGTYVSMALQNLIVNAIKYTPRDRTPDVIVRCEKMGVYTVISVTDNGIGIEPAYADMVFRMFKRLHGPTGEYTGSGIGLPVCKRIARQHKGDCWFESSPGEGSTFYLSLRQPLKR